MKIIAFAASISPFSINNQLVKYAASVIESDIIPDADVEILDLNDYMMPFYRPDLEEEQGVPQEAKDFYAKISEADAVIVSFAEHNGSYTAAYKNTFDWTSRLDIKVYQDKPTILLSTSPGRGGAKSVMGMALNSAGHFGMNVLANVSVPSFNHVFDKASGAISDLEIDAEFKIALGELQELL